MTEDLVSVIMPTFNTGEFLAESIDSILNQTYSYLELLIVDDYSSDENTIKILHSYAQKDNRVKVLFLQQNGGPGVARNTAIECASGQYIAFCDSDDMWASDKLELQIVAMKNGNYALCCSSYYMIDDSGSVVGINMVSHDITYSMMKRDNKIGCLTAIYDIRALGKKYYMPTIRKRQDWALFLAITQECRVACCVEKPLAYYRKRLDSVSSKKLSLVKYNLAIYRECLHFGLIKSWTYFIFLFLPTYFSKLIRQKVDYRNFIHA